MLYAPARSGSSLGCVVQVPQPPPGRRRPREPVLRLTLPAPPSPVIPAATPAALMSKLPPFRAIASRVEALGPEPRERAPFVPQKRPLPPLPPFPSPAYPHPPAAAAAAPAVQDLAALKRPRVEDPQQQQQLQQQQQQPYPQTASTPYIQTYQHPSAVPPLMHPPRLADPPAGDPFAPQRPPPPWGLPSGVSDALVSAPPQGYAPQSQEEVAAGAREALRGPAALQTPAYSLVGSSQSAQIYQEQQQQAATGGVAFAGPGGDPHYRDDPGRGAQGVAERARGMEQAEVRTRGAPGRELVGRGVGGELAGVARQEMVVAGGQREMNEAQGTERATPNFGQPGPDGRYSCPECNKTLLNPTTLQNHIKSVHQNAGTYVCRFCPNGRNNFMWKSTLDIHISHVHQKKRPFNCPYPNCDNSFRWGSHLKEHILVQHNFRKDFKCPICPKTFGRKNNWLKHIRNVHKVSDVPALLSRMRWEVPKPTLQDPVEMEDRRQEAAARAPDHLSSAGRDIRGSRALRVSAAYERSALREPPPKAKKDVGATGTSPRSRRRRGNQQAGLKQGQSRHQEQSGNAPRVLGKA